MSKPSPPAWGGVGWGEQGMATKGDSIDREIAEKALDAVRCQVKHYRMHLKPSFQVMRKRAAHQEESRKGRGGV